jgi:hypothetical protein
MRLHGKIDENQTAIVDALRAVGATVHSTASLGEGFPDILVGFRLSTFLLEVKAEEGVLNPAQRKWHHNWQGRPVVVVRSPEEALIAIGAVSKTKAERLREIQK